MTMKCSICGLPIPAKGTWKRGNNAQPINNGRCCDVCNDNIVIPARIRNLRNNLPMRGAGVEDVTVVHTHLTF